MDNHYHLMIETPDGTLSLGMRQLNGVYPPARNKRHNKTGHLVALLLRKAAAAQAIGGNITWEPEGAAPVFFGHHANVKIHGIRCIECPLSPYQMMTTLDGRASMERMQTGGGCGRCRNGVRAFDVVDPDHCSRCHR